MSEIIVRKDGSSSIAHPSGNGLDKAAVDHHVGEHINLRQDGFQTLEISSGAVLAARRLLLDRGFDFKVYSPKIQAMIGISEHFHMWQAVAGEHGLVAVSSLTTEVELEQEGKEIRSGFAEALAHPELLVVGNFHDEGSSREMKLYMQRYHKLRTYCRRLFHKVLETESEENDFHAANVAEAVGATILMLCTSTDGFRINGKKLDRIHVDDICKLLKYCEAGSASGKGGMGTKLKAAEQFVRRTRASVIIGDSFEDSRRLVEGNAGTWVVQ